jgi:hypothetical protein
MKLSEDWLSVIVGFAFLVLIWIINLPALPWPIAGFMK